MAASRRRPLRPPAGDEAAAIQVVEAVLVAVLIISGLIFMSLMTRPSVPTTADGSDMVDVAHGMMRILEQATVADPVDGTPMAMDEWVDAIVRGNNGTGLYSTYGDDTAAAVDALRLSITPEGIQSMLRLNNGAGTLPLAPPLGPGEGIHPQGAAVAVTYLRPSWNVTDTPTDTYAPGDPLAPNLQNPNIVTAPTGNTTAPAGTAWNAWWGETVPTGVPLGHWILDHAGTLTTIQVAFADVPTTSRPAYGLELVVWRGA